MRLLRSRAHRRGRLAFTLLPALVITLLAAGRQTWQPDPVGTVSVGYGTVLVQASELPAMPMGQMMMPMAESGDHGDSLQVIVRLTNTTDAAATVPFDRIRLVRDDGSSEAASMGLVGALVLRPNASAEERLRFTAPGTPSVHIAVPDGDTDRLVTVAVRS
ncbi:hypothetical protein [Terrabacter sp. BE26]|uniref:hypothetical protein n=1 Tax=Terrabacter sp. BE26 TaxID=2898152 RepID=UPI0035BE756D